MDKSLLAKLVWLGVVLAIPAAILAVQKPEAPRAVESHRVIAVDRPVSVDISDRQIEGAKPAESAPAAEAPKPRAMHIGGERISVKGGQEPAVGKTDVGSKEQNLASVLAPVAGPRATAPAAP
jgi:hypothetical protein